MLATCGRRLPWPTSRPLLTGSIMHNVNLRDHVACGFTVRIWSASYVRDVGAYLPLAIGNPRLLTCSFFTIGNPRLLTCSFCFLSCFFLHRSLFAENWRAGASCQLRWNWHWRQTLVPVLLPQHCQNFIVVLYNLSAAGP